MEDQVTDPDFGGFLEQPGLPATVNQLGEITFQHDRAAAAGLGRFGAESDRPGVPVHVGPLQGDDLALPPAREVGEPGEVLQVGGQGCNHGWLPARLPAPSAASFHPHDSTKTQFYISEILQVARSSLLDDLIRPLQQQGGIVRPRALAVLRSQVGSSGRSEAHEPPQSLRLDALHERVS